MERSSGGSSVTDVSFIEDVTDVKAISKNDGELGGGAENEEPFTDLICKLNFTLKTAQTPCKSKQMCKVGDPLKVFLRVRPREIDTDIEEGAEESEDETQDTIRIEDPSSVVLTAPQESQSFRNGESGGKFTFSHVFAPKTSQKDIFEHTTAPLVDNFVEGQNGLIFAYGITNSGKTYTMQGNTEEPGLIPLVLANLFTRLDPNQPGGAGDLQGCKLWLSYLEIYNEKIFDLLNINNMATSSRRAKRNNRRSQQKQHALRLQAGRRGHVFVRGLKEVEVSSLEEATALLQRGELARAVAHTAANARSSRSHSVLSLSLVKKGEDKNCQGVFAKLAFVDLAGSERSSRTNNVGKRLREAVKINNSLMTLGRCLETLRWNQQHSEAKPRVIPFRDSKVTRLFQDSLQGFGRTVMICTASPQPHDFDETLHALQYAAIAREVVTIPRVDTRNTMPLALTPRAKRQAEKPAGELAREVQRSKRPRKICEGCEAKDAEVDDLLDQVFDLKQHLVDAESKCAAVESSVRQELSECMAEQIKEMEQDFEERMEQEQAAVEAQAQRKLDIWKKHFSKKNSHDASLAATLRLHREELEEARARIAKEQMHTKEVREEAKEEIAKLQAALKAAQEAQLEQEDAKKKLDLFEAEASVCAAQLRSDLEAQLERVAEMEEEQCSTQAEAAEAKRLLEEANRKVAELEEQGKIEQEKWNNELAKELTRVVELEEELKAKRAELQTLEERVVDGKTKSHDHVEKLKAEQKRVGTLQDQLSAATAQVEELEGQVSLQTRALGDIQAQLEASEERASQQLQALQQQLDTAKARLVDGTAAMETMLAEQEEKNKEKVETLTLELEKTHKEAKKNQEALAKAKDNLKRVRASHKKTKQQLSDARREKRTACKELEKVQEIQEKQKMSEEERDALKATSATMKEKIEELQQTVKEAEQKASDRAALEEEIVQFQQAATEGALRESAMKEEVEQLKRAVAEVSERETVLKEEMSQLQQAVVEAGEREATLKERLDTVTEELTTLQASKTPAPEAVHCESERKQKKSVEEEEPPELPPRPEENEPEPTPSPPRRVRTRRNVSPVVQEVPEEEVNVSLDEEPTPVPQPKKRKGRKQKRKAPSPEPEVEPTPPVLPPRDEEEEEEKEKVVERKKRKRCAAPVKPVRTYPTRLRTRSQRGAASPQEKLEEAKHVNVMSISNLPEELFLSESEAEEPQHKRRRRNGNSKDYARSMQRLAMEEQGSVCTRASLGVSPLAAVPEEEPADDNWLEEVDHRMSTAFEPSPKKTPRKMRRLFTPRRTRGQRARDKQKEEEQEQQEEEEEEEEEALSGDKSLVWGRTGGLLDTLLAKKKTRRKKAVPKCQYGKTKARRGQSAEWMDLLSPAGADVSDLSIELDLLEEEVEEVENKQTNKRAKKRTKHKRTASAIQQRPRSTRYALRTRTTSH